MCVCLVDAHQVKCALCICADVCVCERDREFVCVYLIVAYQMMWCVFV